MAVKENSPKKCFHRANKNYQQGYCHIYYHGQTTVVVQFRSVKE